MFTLNLDARELSELRVAIVKQGEALSKLTSSDDPRYRRLVESRIDDLRTLLDKIDRVRRPEFIQGGDGFVAGREADPR